MRIIGLRCFMARRIDGRRRKKDDSRGHLHATSSKGYLVVHWSDLTIPLVWGQLELRLFWVWVLYWFWPRSMTKHVLCGTVFMSDPVYFMIWLKKLLSPWRLLTVVTNIIWLLCGNHVSFGVATAIFYACKCILECMLLRHIVVSSGG